MSEQRFGGTAPAHDNWGRDLAQGALGGGLLTAPMIGLMYLLDKMTGLPFAPFMLFDWITRVLPGGLVTFGIDSMIDVMNMLGMSVASSAKTVEQIVAILFFLLIGIVLGAVYLVVMRKLDVTPRPVVGVILGIGFGVPMIAVSLPMEQSGASPIFTIIGLGALFLVWGLAFIPVYRKLVYSGTDLEIEHEIRWAKSINRRQFLVRLGASAATVTVVSAGLGTVLAQREQRMLDQATSGAGETVPRRPLPNDGDPVTPAPGTRPEYTAVEDHYKVFIRSSPTEIDINTWSLPITGLVANPMVLSLDDIRHSYESRDQYVTPVLHLRTHRHRPDQHHLVDRSQPPEYPGRRSTAGRSPLPDYHFGRRLLRDCEPGPDRIRRADHVVLRMGRETPPLRSWLPVEDMVARPLRHEATQVDHRHRSNSGIRAGILGRERLG